MRLLGSTYMAACGAALTCGFVLHGTSAYAQQSSWQANYGVSLIGLPIGTAQVNAELDSARYKIDIQARLTGLAGMVTGGKGAGAASGGLSGGRPVSAGYSASGSNGREARTIRMAVSGGNATAVEINPPIIKKPDAIPVADGHKRGITDPVTALLMPVPAGQIPISPAACNRSIQIFDGNARYDIALSYAGTRNVEGRGYNGPVAVCNARYTPISGHRNGKATQFMAANRDIQAWLAPVAGAALVAPYRISVRSEIGMVVIEATRFDGPVATATTTGAAPQATGSTPVSTPARGQRAGAVN
jgi:hypothetical protein